MTQNRRPGFRLPWTSDEDASADTGTSQNADLSSEATATDAPGADPTRAPSANGSTPAQEVAAAAPDGATESDSTVAPHAAGAEGEAEAAASEGPEPPAVDAPVAAAPPQPAQPSAPSAADAESETDFMRDLVAAMRGVADEARRSTSAEVQSRANEQMQQLEADSQRRREELQSKADADVAGVGEWATAEAERIRVEAEQRVAARRAQLEEQLAAESHRGEAESRAVRDRLAEYERELDAYHAQLSEITDPAAFAAAAKRMPPPPSFTAEAAAAASAATAPAAPPAPDFAAEPEATTAPTDEPAAEPAADPAAEPAAIPAAMAELLPPSDDQNGTQPVPESTAPEPGTLAQRLAQLRADAAAEGSEAPSRSSDERATAGESATTEVVVRGLGSFGAITGFRQALSGVDGIDGVSLSLGQSGEFVFRATHAPGFDVAGAIVGLEGESAQVEPTSAGGLHVTLERAR